MTDTVENNEAWFYAQGGQRIGPVQAEKLREEFTPRKRDELLKAIYDTTKDRDEPVFVAQLGAQTGLSEAEANAAWRYLRDRRLIKTFNLDYTAQINARGTDAIEAASPRETLCGADRIFSSREIDRFRAETSGKFEFCRIEIDVHTRHYAYFMHTFLEYFQIFFHT